MTSITPSISENAVDQDRLDKCNEYGRRFSIDLYRGNFTTQDHLAQQAKKELSRNPTTEGGFLEVSIYDIGLPQKVSATLAEEVEVFTLGDLLVVPLLKIQHTSNIGPRSIEILIRKIIGHGESRDQQWRELIEQKAGLNGQG
jgi:hypothetical protein